MHLVGFITRKFVTVHDHMNLKLHICFKNSLIFTAAEGNVSQYIVSQVNKFRLIVKTLACFLSFFPVQTSSCLIMVPLKGYCCTQ